MFLTFYSGIEMRIDVLFTQTELQRGCDVVIFYCAQTLHHAKSASFITLTVMYRICSDTSIIALNLFFNKRPYTVKMCLY